MFTNRTLAESLASEPPSARIRTLPSNLQRLFSNSRPVAVARSASTLASPWVMRTRVKTSTPFL